MSTPPRWVNLKKLTEKYFFRPDLLTEPTVAVQRDMCRRHAHVTTVGML